MVPQRFHGVFSQLLKEQGTIPVIDEAADLEAENTEVPDAPALRPGQIAVDMYEDSGYLIIKAPIAGVKLADIDIDVADNKITIRGVRKQNDDLSEAKMLVEECYWGPFEREVTLPQSVNPSKVKATFSKDNILKVIIPKEERKVRIVKINEGG